MVVLWVEVNLAIESERLAECESKNVAESESGTLKCVGEVGNTKLLKTVGVLQVKVNMSFESESISESESEIS